MSKYIKQVMQVLDPAAKVYLYGSRARRKARKDSDWDLLILTPKEHVTLQEEQRYRHQLSEVELTTGQTLSIFVYSTHEWDTKYSVTPIHQSVTNDGLLLYG